MAHSGTFLGMGFGAPAPPATTTFTRLSWGDAATLSLLTVLATFFFPSLGQLQQQLFRRWVHRRVRWLAAIVDPDLSVTISQYVSPRGSRMLRRSDADAYEEAKAYIGAESRSRRARHLRAEVPRNAADKLLFNMLDGEEVAVEFQGATIWWSAYTNQENRAEHEIGYRLHFEERHRDLVLDTYLPHVRREGRAIMVRDRQRKIFTNTHDGWANHVPFDHPMTFDTLAIGIKNKSVIVIEDIDCSLDLTGARDKTKPAEDDGDDDGASTSAVATVVSAEENKKSTNGSTRSQPVTMSGLLNFIDGLWSACGEERIIVFTTNHVGKLDPALIRKGRMDERIEMSYCGCKAFKFLAKLYLDVESHELFGTIEELLGEVKVTPVDVAEKLTRKGKRKYDDAGFFLAGLVTELDTIKRAKGSA